MMQKINILLFTFIFLTGWFLALPSTNGLAQPTEKQLQEALSAVLQEPKVKDAAWLDKNIPSLMVGVWDNGANRDGYASYICLVLYDFGIKGGVVRVMDQAKAINSEWEELGKAWCPK